MSAKGRRHRFARSVLLTACLTAGSARAADFTWTGGGVTLTNGWASVFNWSGKLPLSATTTDLTFAGTTGLTNTQNLANPFALNTLTFDPSAGSFNIGGQPLAFSTADTGAAINQNSPNLQSITSGITLNNDVALTGTGELRLAAPFAGGGSFIKTSTGDLTLDLAGKTTNQAGSLQVFKGAATITGAGAVSFNANGQTGFGGFSSFFVEVDSSLRVTGGAVVNASGTPSVHNNGVLTVDGGAQINVTPNAQNVAELRIGFAGGQSVLAVGGGGSVTAGTIRLGSTFPGNGLLRVDAGGTASAHVLNVVSGEVRVASGGALTVGSIVAAPGTVPTFTLSNPLNRNFDALTVGADNADTDLPVNLVDGPEGPGSILKVGSGTLTLSRDQTFSGRTDIAGGRVVVASAKALQNSTVSMNGGTLTFANTLSGATVGALDGFSGVVDLAGTTVTVGTPHRMTVFGGVITGSGGLEVVGNGDGSGSLTLEGSTPNTYAGLTRVVGGTLVGHKFPNVNAVGGDLVILPSGNADFSRSFEQLPDNSGVLLAGGALNFGAVETIGKLTIATTAPTFLGANRLNLSSTAPYALDASVPFAAGNFTVGLTGATGGGVRIAGDNNLPIRWDLGNAFREFNVPGAGTLRLSGPIGNGSLRKTGAGTLFLDSANNSYNGTRIIEGTLQIGASDLDLGLPPTTFGINVALAGGILRAAETVTLAPTRRVLVDGPATTGFDVADGKTLTLMGAMTFNFNDTAHFQKLGTGELRLAGGSQVDPNAFDTALVRSGTFRLASRTLASAIVNDATLVVDGGATVDSTVDNSGAPGSTGQTTVQTGAELKPFSLRQASLTVNGRVTIKPSGGGVPATASVVRTLSIGPAGRLDISNRRLIVDYDASAPSPLSSVRQMIINGFTAGGAAPWSAGGLTSINAQNQANLAIGYVEAAEVASAGELFGDVAVDGSAVLVRTTLAGDANLDGSVDFNDLVKLAQNYNSQVSRTTQSWWTHGDFNYDGTVDFNDLVKLAQNYNGALPAAPAGLSTEFQQDFARALAQVPEPGAAVLVGIAFCGLVRRRRSR